MKVLIVSNCIPSERYPLNGIFAYDQAKALYLNGVDVTLFAIDLRSILRKRPYGITHEVRNGISCHTISLPLGKVPYRLFCFIGGIAIRILYSIAYRGKTKPDLLHAHFTDMGKITSVLSERIGVPYVITEHSSRLNQKEISKSLRLLAFDSYNKSSQVIAVSSLLAKSIRKFTGIEAVVVPNVIDFDTFSKGNPESHIGYRIVTTANLIYRKRTINIIRAIEKLAPQYTDLCLDIIGDGPLMGDLKNYVNNHKLDSIVKFHGRLSREDTAKVYSISDCFVLVSEIETFGVVFAEAMASGLPVIASRCGGPEDFVTEQNGILVDVDNQEQLENAIIEIKNSDYITENIKNIVRDNYGSTALFVRLLDIYNRVTKQKE